MVATYRERQIFDGISGRRYWSASYTDYLSTWTQLSQDFVGDPTSDHPFLLTNITADGSRMSGTFDGVRPGYSPGQFGYVRYENYVPEAVRLLTGWLPYPPWEGEDLYAQQLAAKTNPSTPHVSLPVSFVELRDLPRLVKTYGDTLLKFGRKGSKALTHELAEHNLAYQFGIAPLVRDLGQLLNFQDAVERRFEEIKALDENGGFKRNIVLDTYDDSVFLPNIAFDRAGITGDINADRTIQSYRKVWGTIRWRPAYSGHLPATDKAKLRLAKRLVLGLHHGQITDNVWNALPWTWLYDWFFGISDFLQSNNSVIAHAAARICIMNTGWRRNSYTNLRGSFGSVPIPSWYGAVGPFERYGKYWKQRFVTSIPTTPIARIPVIGSGKLSILASLGILRSRRGYRN